MQEQSRSRLSYNVGTLDDARMDGMYSKKNRADAHSTRALAVTCRSEMSVRDAAPNGVTRGEISSTNLSRAAENRNTRSQEQHTQSPSEQPAGVS